MIVFGEVSTTLADLCRLLLVGIIELSLKKVGRRYFPDKLFISSDGDEKMMPSFVYELA